MANLLSSNRPRYLRVHFLNNTCVRNRNCGTYEPLYGYTLASLEKAIVANDPKIFNHLRARVRLYRALQAVNPNTEILVSPILEHNLSKSAWRVLANAVLQEWPEVRLVNSGMRGVSTERYRGALIEEHGMPVIANGNTYSHDGTEVTDISIKDWNSGTAKALISFTWTRSYNLRTQNPTWVDPRARTAAPDSRLLEHIIHITDPVEKLPTLTKTCKRYDFDSTFIWKPLAEDKGNNDSRANLPVLIAKQDVSAAVLVDFNGKRVATLGKYGKYVDGRFRYYSGYRGGSWLGGYEIQRKAFAQSGSSYTYFKVKDRCYGPILTARRQGSYR